MFDTLSDRLEGVFKKLKGQGRITERNIEEALREVRLALLEADVNIRVVRDFIEHVKHKALGQEVLRVADARAALHHASLRPNCAR